MAPLAASSGGPQLLPLLPSTATYAAATLPCPTVAAPTTLPGTLDFITAVCGTSAVPRKRHTLTLLPPLPPAKEICMIDTEAK